MAGCESPKSQSPIAPPLTAAVAQGYMRGYDHSLDFGFDYPEDVKCRCLIFEFHLEKVEELTKDGKETRIVISVRLTNSESLTEVTGFGYMGQQSIVEKAFVTITDRQA